MINSNIHLRDIDEKNWYECCLLELTEEQQKFIEPNAILILQSKFEATLKPYTIYSDDKMI